MSDDLMDILGGGGSQSPAASPSKGYAPLDAALRTVYAEAPPNASPDELKAIASVIVNRSKKSGKDVGSVVQEPGQFESWKDPKGRARIDGLDPKSDTYAALQNTVGPILAGNADPTTDATLFYAPDAQAKATDGRPAKPAWDDGTGRRIGASLFFTPTDAPAQGNDLAAVLGGRAPAPADAPTEDTADLTGEHLVDIFNEPQKATLSPKQQKTRDMLFNGGGLDPLADPGSLKYPYMLGPDDKPENAPKGAYYIDRDGHMGRVPGGGKDSSFAAGTGRGVADVAQSIGEALPGAGDSEILNRLRVNNLQYGAQYGGDTKSGLGRFTGQLVGSLPIMGAVEAGAVPAMTRFLGPAGEFLAGNAGKAALSPAAGAGARVGRLALRGASLAASGAQEGAGAAFLTHSADDRPLPEQMATGAVLGGVLKPGASVVAPGMRRFFGGPDLAGAADLPTQRDIVAKASGLPVPVQLSLGDITGAPAQQMLENSMLRGANGDAAAGVVQAFDHGQQGQLKANVQAIADNMAGGAAEPGAGGRAVSDKLAAMHEDTFKAVGAAYDAARARGEDAMLATAKDVRDGMLGGLRSNYDLDRVGGVSKVVEDFGQNGAPTVRELFETRTKLSNLTQSNDPVEAGAARKAISILDAYRDTALKNDLFLGDPAAVDAWKKAVSSRAAAGKLFEGGDLIEDLTEKVSRGGGTTLKVDPQEATNYIFGLSNLGFRRNLGRDLKRLQGVLGANSDEWNALRADAFLRLARGGRGGTEGGEQLFSGANFLKAWNKAKTDNAQVVGVLFTPGERKLIDDFAEVAQRVTSPVKGGDNSSNSAITGKKLLEPVMRFLSVSGGAGGGAALGGVPGAAIGATMGGLMKSLQEIVAVGKARKFTYGAKPSADLSGRRPLLTGPAPGVIGGVLANSLTTPGSSQ